MTNSPDWAMVCGLTLTLGRMSDAQETFRVDLCTRSKLSGSCNFPDLKLFSMFLTVYIFRLILEWTSLVVSYNIPSLASLAKMAMMESASIWFSSE